MMQHKRLSWFVIAFAVFFTLVFAFKLAPAAEFTADIVITGTGDNYTFKLHVRDNMTRLQTIHRCVSTWKSQTSTEPSR